MVLIEQDNEVSVPADGENHVPCAARMEKDHCKKTAGQLLRDVKIHFQVQDWKGAVTLLYKLVALEPLNANYRGFLAKAMSKHPSTRRKAVGHFIEALRLAPKDADLHYSLGLCYRSFGLRYRAGVEFRAALRIEPRHEEAKSHLFNDGDCGEPKKVLHNTLDRVFL